MLRRIWVVLVLNLAVVAGPVCASDIVAQAVRADTAEEAVSLATGEVLTLIRAGKEYAADEPERFYTEVESMLRPLIDFPRFARNVMGPYYREATEAQRERFAESFKWSLVRTYALALVEFGDGDVAVLPPRKAPKNPNKVNVTQEITYQGQAYVVVYRMQRSKELTWRVQNLVVEGVNVGLNYKSQFASAMKDSKFSGDMDAVIDAWADVLDAEEESAPAEPTEVTPA